MKKAAAPPAPVRPPGEFWDELGAILEADQRPPDGSHHPSSSMWTNPDGSHGGKCVLAYIQRMRAVMESDPPDAESRLQMSTGNWIERGIMATLKRHTTLGYQVGEKAVAVPGLRYPVTYSTDFIQKKDGELIGRDLKTTQGYSYDKITAVPDAGHTAQLYWYAKLSGITTWTLEYLDRAAGRRLTHRLMFPDEGYPVINDERVPFFDFASLLGGWQTAERYLPGGELASQDPPPSYDAKGFPCWWRTKTSTAIKGCGYRSLCPAYRAVVGS